MVFPHVFSPNPGVTTASLLGARTSPMSSAKKDATFCRPRLDMKPVAPRSSQCHMDLYVYVYCVQYLQLHHIRMYIYICIYIYMLLYICIYIYMCYYIYTYTCDYVYIYIYICDYIYIYTHTSIYDHISYCRFIVSTFPMSPCPGAQLPHVGIDQWKARLSFGPQLEELDVRLPLLGPGLEGGYTMIHLKKGQWHRKKKMNTCRTWWETINTLGKSSSFRHKLDVMYAICM